jgi:hypothetical protein
MEKTIEKNWRKGEKSQIQNGGINSAKKAIFCLQRYGKACGNIDSPYSASNAF